MAALMGMTLLRNLVEGESLKRSSTAPNTAQPLAILTVCWLRASGPLTACNPARESAPGEASRSYPLSDANLSYHGTEVAMSKAIRVDTQAPGRR